ncbi:MAG: NAD-dependent epimerase/dehydratase family protein [Anaerolineae bacterium]|nr:NAD-dependent epimerase/dehydratase family protein [Anaerolineae bacterium]
MRILVTGGAGFIGSHVVDACVEQGHAVTVVDNLSTGHRRNVNPAAGFYEVDITDQAALLQVCSEARPEIISHHAAQVNVRHSIANPNLDARVNVLGSINVLECAREVGARKVIYSSSGGTVYGEPESVPCPESHPIQPLSPYGASKYIVEHYLHIYYKNHGIVYTVFRYGNVFGPRQDPEGEAGVIAIFAQMMLRDETPVIFGSGNAVRDYVYVEDCARANVLALTRGDGQVINIGTGVPTTVNQIFTALQPLTHFNRDPQYDPPKKGEIFRTYLDIHKAQDALGWSPQVTLEKGLIPTVQAFASDPSA